MRLQHQKAQDRSEGINLTRQVGRTPKAAVGRALGPYAPLLWAWLLGIAFLALARLALSIGFRDSIAGTPDLWRMFAIGVRMDTILLSMLLALPALLLGLLPAGPLRNRSFAACIALIATVLVLMEFATPSFIGEYDKRPDRIFVEYLGHPQQILSMLWANHKLSLFGVPVATALAAWLGWRLGRRLLDGTTEWGWLRRLAVLPLVVLVLVAGARSSLDKRPANISTASYSSNRLVNELTLNSTYTLLYALNSMRYEVDVPALYGSMPWPEVQHRVASYSGVPPANWLDGGRSIRHTIPGTRSTQPLNLVVILQESLGAGYAGYLGGLPLTPNIDRLGTEGLRFMRLYATGTRTSRGIEAVVSGFPPSPALAALKLPAAQKDFFTLATILKERGYDTEFLYGGGANFDNMRGFLKGNGFQRVIEQRDFKNPDFVASWGVSDEDLMLRANEEFKRPRDKPFFALLLSSSNHEPFEIPEGRIEPYEQPLYSRANSIKYADHAVGRFFEMAKREAYYANTVFVVVADHDARVFGKDLVPVEHFHIPGFVVGPGVPVGDYAPVASQIDLGPTALALIGVDGPVPMPGRNLLALPPGTPGRALMQYGLNHGFMIDDRLVVHAPNEPARTFTTDGKVLTPAAPDPELERDALAHALWPYEVYRQRLYQ